MLAPKCNRARVVAQLLEWWLLTPGPGSRPIVLKKYPFSIFLPLA